ncbi:hypothetical protein RND81_14G100000 [Saponaria officinalis]|uniref:EF-hand domain-containing protein n=1 Tax=Saponaria officinalis TaxID=3572 RepID=A0AAW1GW49_SAPOF
MDEDGSLTLLELAALLRSLVLKPTGDQLDAMLTTIIEFDELFHTILPQMNDQIMANQGHLSEVFNMFDRDGNAAELAGAMAKMGEN